MYVYEKKKAKNIKNSILFYMKISDIIYTIQMRLYFLYIIYIYAILYTLIVYILYIFYI